MVEGAELAAERSEFPPHLRKNIDFKVEIIDDSGQLIGSWQASFNTTKLYCTSEQLSVGGAGLDVQDGAYSVNDVSPPAPLVVSVPRNSTTMVSCARTLVGDRFPSLRTRSHSVTRGRFCHNSRKRLCPIRSSSSSDSSRGPDPLTCSRQSNCVKEPGNPMDRWGWVGLASSSFLYDLGAEKRSEINATLKRAYKQLDEMSVKPLRSGWKQLEVRELYGDKTLITEARHINDGMLRLTAILAELGSDHRFLLLDEIENGVNPEIVEFVVNLLTSTPKQVLVTTHSPMILNYLDDDVARSAVVYLYKTSEGFTKAIPFFSIPSLAKKLEVMGPGEAFVDTNLTLLGDEIEQMAGALKMYFLLSGEGATDLGVGRPGPLVVEGEDYLYGPMTLFTDRIIESRHGYSPLEFLCCGYISERILAARGRELKAVKKSVRLPGPKRPIETRDFFNTARLLARFAREKRVERNDDVVAVLFRDADGTASAQRGLWQDSANPCWMASPRRASHGVCR